MTSMGTSLMSGSGSTMPPPSAIASVPLMGPTTSVAGSIPVPAAQQPQTGSVPQPQGGRKQSVVIGPNATLVPHTLVAKIRNNEFVELGELAGDSLAYQEKTGACSSSCEEKARRSKRQRINNILQWVECFNAYMIILDQPERTPDMLAYSSLIVHAARKFKGEGWLQ